MGQGELLWPWKRNGSDSLGEMTKLICPEPARWGLWFRPPANCIRPDSLRGTGARCVSWGPSQNSALLGPRENQPLNFTVLFTQALRGVGSSRKPYFSLYSDCFLPKVSPREANHAALQNQPDSRTAVPHRCGLSPLSLPRPLHLL